jgi:hypothetical protein
MTPQVYAAYASGRLLFVCIRKLRTMRNCLAERNLRGLVVHGSENRVSENGQE